MDRLVGALEAVLFASGEPVSHGALLEILQIDGPRLEQLLDNYRQELLERHSGLQLQQIAGGWQLATNMDYYDYVQRLSGTSICLRQLWKPYRLLLLNSLLPNRK